MIGRLSLVALAVSVWLLGGCGRSNPVLGDWELDRSETPQGTVLVVQAAGLETLSFDRGGARSGDTEIPGDWVVEESQARLVRKDGRGEHVVEMLPDDRIRVELPVGVSAVYRRKP